MKKLLLILFVGLLIGQPTSLVRFGGSITESDGTVIIGTRTVVFNIYDAETGGSPLWASTRTVTLTNGHFDVDLGAVTPLALPFDEDYFVEITVAGETMTPRVPLPTTAYAQRAEHVTNAVQSVSSSVDHTGRTGHLRFVPMDGTEVTESMSAEDDTIYIAMSCTGSGSTTDLTPAKPIVIAKSGSVPSDQTEFLEAVRIEPPTPGNLFIPTHIRLEHYACNVRYTINYSDGSSYVSDNFSAGTGWLTVFDASVPPHSGYAGFITSIVVEASRYGTYYTGSIRLSLAGYEIEP